MTCREFKQRVASLSLAEMAQTNEMQIAAHAETCPSCGGWLAQQRALAASMHALRAQTAGRDAGPDVERALLRVFRQGISAGVLPPGAAAEVAAGGQKPARAEVTGPSESLGFKPAPASTPLAWRLSRVFEVGAYVAAAAAIAVAIFLGIHLLQRRPEAPVQSQSVPAEVAPAIQQPVTTASGSEKVPSLRPRRRERSTVQSLVMATRKQSHQQAPTEESVGATVQAASDESPGDAESAYTALMFCDPLSCSSDAQVVRMELPGRGAQPQVADVVVGYDGAVRAVRFVN